MLCLLAVAAPLASAEETPVVAPAPSEESPEAVAEPSAGEVDSEMPEAVEEFLRSARDLRLQSDTDRLRRSKYTYPLRRVHAPSNVGRSVSSSPVPAGHQPSEPEATVISF